MSKRAIIDEYGCELTAEEHEELDRKAEEITERFFGDKKGADQAAVVHEKKKPGRPKKVQEEKQRDEIPQIVRDVITEKIDLLERMIRTYDENIETLRMDLTQQISDLEDRKKDAGEKITALMAYMGGE